VLRSSTFINQIAGAVKAQHVMFHVEQSVEIKFILALDSHFGLDMIIHKS